MKESVSLNLRVPPALKARVVAYSEDVGLTYNVAAMILLDRALAAEGRPALRPTPQER